MNDELVKSLKQDIKKINETNESILSNLNSCENVSCFLFCKDENEGASVDDVIANSEEPYLNTLELLIDRLYLFISCLLRFIENECDKDEDNKSSKYIVRPKNLTLGTTVKMLWKQLDDFRPVYENLRRETNKLNQNSKMIQTHISSFDTCYTCATVYNFVKGMVEMFEKKMGAFGINQEMALVRQNIFNLTQHSCMEKFLEKIENNLILLGEENNSLKTTLDKMKIDYEAKRNQNGNLKKDLKKMQETNEQLEQKQIKEQTKLEELRIENDELNKKIENLEDEKEKLIKTELYTIEVEEKLNTAKEEKTKLLDELKELNYGNKKIQADRDLWKKRFLYENRENSNMKKSISQTKVAVSEVKTHLTKINLDYKDLNDLLNKNTIEYQNTILRYNKILERLKEIIAIKIAAKQGENKNSDIEENINLEGNPLNDMSNQVKANEALIEKLTEKNDHLTKILKKLKSK